MIPRSRTPFVFIIAILTACLLLPAVSYGAGENTQAPDFTLNTLANEKLSLGQFRGKYLLVNFWATWCGPCKMEMPSLEKLYRRFKSRNFSLLAVSGDMFGDKVVRPFVEANNLTFPVLLDQRLTVSHKYGVVSLPTTFLIDPEGKIIGVHEGADDWSHPEVLQFFEGLLKPS
ncbi:MAG: TlpA family protein disulfide reductase [Nitrospinae bacterium]|nr:TlpA family protein disulfide reductase [Nitrospinota bacterium]